MHEKMTFSALKLTFRIVKTTFSRLKVTFSGNRETNTIFLFVSEAKTHLFPGAPRACIYSTETRK